MLTYLKHQKYSNFLTCPFCKIGKSSSLKKTSKGFKCKNCKRNYDFKGKVLDFLKSDKLNENSKREIGGNNFAFNKQNIKHYANKDKWSNYYNHYVNRKFSILDLYLDTIDFEVLVSLGSGPGFEIKEILKRRNVTSVLSSDIAINATRVVPFTLKGFDTTIGLFTSDLNFPPILPNETTTVIIYEAVHHTGDMIKSINNLLVKRYKNILLIEPTTNFIVKVLAFFGIAQRTEYSGLKPEFLNLNKLKKIAEKKGYQIDITTLWDIPEDYFRIICKKPGFVQAMLLVFIDMFSDISNLFKFGNFSVILLKRKGDK